jgi:ectoine hydroxylase-related dioxygenase (phytanoyl-CoA dioxygenase family)
MFDGADGSDLICEAWLGPGYAMTTQTNIVKPGGKAQAPHRDYRKFPHVRR